MCGHPRPSPHAGSLRARPYDLRRRVDIRSKFGSPRDVVIGGEDSPSKTLS